LCFALRSLYIFNQGVAHLYGAIWFDSTGHGRGRSRFVAQWRHEAGKSARRCRKNGENGFSPFKPKAQYVVYLTLIDYHKWCYLTADLGVSSAPAVECHAGIACPACCACASALGAKVAGTNRPARCFATSGAQQRFLRPSRSLNFE